jgi:hypothetical protein
MGYIKRIFAVTQTIQVDSVDDLTNLLTRDFVPAVFVKHVAAEMQDDGFGVCPRHHWRGSSARSVSMTPGGSDGTACVSEQRKSLAQLLVERLWIGVADAVSG